MNILKSVLYLFGFDIHKFTSSISGLFLFIKDYRKIKRLLKNDNDFSFGKFYPVLNEFNIESGHIDGSYFHQDLLVAKKIYKNNPTKHVDIGSRVDGFISHCAVFREIEVFDIRPQSTTVENIVFKQADLMKLSPDYINYCDSISSLHAIEHFGLGRYGDPINIDGHLKAIHNVWNMLQPSGKFYFSVPIGIQRIEFNAHRIFSVRYLLRILEDKFSIDNFSYIDDSGKLFLDVPLNDDTLIDEKLNFNFGTGIFELTKK